MYCINHTAFTSSNSYELLQDYLKISNGFIPYFPIIASQPLTVNLFDDLSLIKRGTCWKRAGNNCI